MFWEVFYFYEENKKIKKKPHKPFSKSYCPVLNFKATEMSKFPFLHTKRETQAEFQGHVFEVYLSRESPSSLYAPFAHSIYICRKRKKQRSVKQKLYIIWIILLQFCVAGINSSASEKKKYFYVCGI